VAPVPLNATGEPKQSVDDGEAAAPTPGREIILTVIVYAALQPLVVLVTV
jgi:hypothetical protein